MMIANKMEKIEEGQILYQKLNTVVTRYLKMQISYLGAIPQDVQLEKAVMQQMPVSLQNENAKSARAYEQIAEKLMHPGEDTPAIKKRGMAAFFAHFIGTTQQ